MKVLVFAGSTRTDSLNKKLARAAAEALRNVGFDATLADLRDYAMPMYDGDLEAAQGLSERAKAFKDLARSHDAMAIASPEYNGSLPAVLKNTIDWISRATMDDPPLVAFDGKKAMLLSASPGKGGGRRVLRHLRELLQGIRVSVTETQVSIAEAGDAFGPASELLRAGDRESLERAAAELAAAVRGTVAAA